MEMGWNGPIKTYWKVHLPTGEVQELEFDVHAYAKFDLLPGDGLKSGQALMLVNDWNRAGLGAEVRWLYYVRI